MAGKCFYEGRDEGKRHGKATETGDVCGKVTVHGVNLWLIIFASPETMGAIPAVVYILLIIVFIPFPFYKDIVTATSGGGNREYETIVPEVHVETGRILHRFPHNKVITQLPLCGL